MTLTFEFTHLQADDLRSRNRAEVFVHVEADLAVMDDGREIYAELAFPVVELAAALGQWRGRPHADRTDFEFESLSFEEVGVVRIVRADLGWQVGSVFAPEIWSRPVSDDDLDRRIDDFIAKLRRSCREQLGLEIDVFLAG